MSELVNNSQVLWGSAYQLTMTGMSRTPSVWERGLVGEAGEPNRAADSDSELYNGGSWGCVTVMRLAQLGEFIGQRKETIQNNMNVIVCSSKLVR